MRCDICRGPIKPLLNESGEVVWKNGHNPWPISYDNIGNLMPKDARCCDDCNGDVLIARLNNTCKGKGKWMQSYE